MFDCVDENIKMAIMSCIITFLSPYEIANVKSAFVCGVQWREVINGAATIASIATVQENEKTPVHEMHSKIKNNSRHGCNSKMYVIIQKNTLVCPVMKFLQIMYGPKQPLPFDRIIKGGLQYSGDARSRLSVSDGSRRMMAAALASNKVLSGGKHYASFVIRDALYYSIEIGIVRPITESGWERIVRTTTGDRFQILSNRTIEQMNKERTTNWQGDIDLCSLGHAGGHVRVKSFKFPTDEHYNYTTPLWRPFPYEEMCFLLDLDGGTLSYYSNGIQEREMAKGLAGEYIWFIQICGHGRAGAEDLASTSWLSIESRQY